MRFKIDWASLIVGSKCTVLALFYFVFEGNFPSTSPQGSYIWRGDLTKGFFALPVWEAYIWRGLFSKILRYFKTLGVGQAVAGTSSLSRSLSSNGANRAAVGLSLMLNLAD